RRSGQLPGRRGRNRRRRAVGNGVPVDLGFLAAWICAWAVSAGLVALDEHWGSHDNEQPTTHREEGTMAKAKAKRKPKAAKRVLFGGYQVSFKGRTDTLQSLFGSAPMPPSDMTKLLWEYVKRHRLATKG